jgi:two-component system LytT family response regulator
MSESRHQLRVAIVDDEDLARGIVREYLSAEADVEIVAECANGFEAVKAVAELRPHLLFLDVQMPKLDGFEVLELVAHDVAVVFTTAYDEYALRAFEVHAVDYLLKPFGPERLSAALARVRERLERAEPQAAVSQLAAATRARERSSMRVLVRDGPRVHVIPLDRIDYVQAQDDYISFRVDGRDFLKDQTLAEAESSIDPARFIRIHRSYLLNVDRLVRVDLDERENRIAVLRDGRTLPVSRSGYERLSRVLKAR